MTKRLFALPHRTLSRHSPSRDAVMHPSKGDSAVTDFRNCSISPASPPSYSAPRRGSANPWLKRWPDWRQRDLCRCFGRRRREDGFGIRANPAPPSCDLRCCQCRFCQRLAASARQKFPRLDIAVTTPGLNIRKTILDYNDDDLYRVINLNIKGTVWFFQAFGRIMMEQRGGSLIACSSVRAVTIEPGLAVYGRPRRRSASGQGFASEVGASGFGSTPSRRVSPRPH